MDMIISLVVNFLTILNFCIFLSVIFSFFPTARSHKFVEFINAVSEPILKKIKSFLPKTGMIDFSPLVALILIDLIITFLHYL